MFFGGISLVALLVATTMTSTTAGEHMPLRSAAESDSSKLAEAEDGKRGTDDYLSLREEIEKYGRLKDLEDDYLELLFDALDRRGPNAVPVPPRDYYHYNSAQQPVVREKKYGPLSALAQHPQADRFYYGGAPNRELGGGYLDYYYKRAPMGFQGMRGKKSSGEQYYGPSSEQQQQFDKRAPMGFQGMRGKKDFDEMLYELEKRRMMLGFQGMRGKKSSAGESDELPEPPQKRARMGFQGMRGRKSSYLDQLDELEKRAILGFHGMRGKKDMSYEREEMPGDVDNYIEKRPMMMGFHGMRGKRSVDNSEK